MASNSTDICGLGPNFYALFDNMSFAAYIVFTPIYFFICVPTQSLCVFVFYKQSKKEKGYAYQIYNSIADLLEVVANTLNNVCKNKLAGLQYPGM